MASTRKLAENTELVDRFMSLVPIGRENAIQTEALVDALNIAYNGGNDFYATYSGAGRVVRQLALIAVQQGYVLAGDSVGYYVPRHREELEATLGRHEAALRTKLDRLSTLRRSAAAYFGA